MKNCIITGASSGIGRATAIKLAETKCFENIILLGRSLFELENVKEEIEKYGSINAEVFQIDFSKPEIIPSIIEDIYEKYHNIDCLMNIAGYTDPQSLFTTTLESMELTYKINVFSPFVLTRECAKFMKKKGGKILNVASTAGMTPRPGWLSYSSSKAAVISMSETLSAELAEYGVLVYCVSPGRCATKLRKRLAPNEDPSTIMQPEEVADVLCNLVSDNERCLDGQNIVIRKQIKK